jgi:sigma-B regulation protein RsbU (phosphoserine phosphatase)
LSSKKSSESDAPAIGFLTESVNSLYQSRIWIGVSDEAVKRGYSLICYAGGSLNVSSWDPFEPQRNSIYNHIDVHKLKGLVISGSLGNFISPAEFNEFLSKFKDIPLVCLGPRVQGIPSVIVDNTSGMRELISHLVEDHNCKKIAFVRGPEGNQEAEQRLKIFREVLLEHGVRPDPDLIMPGDFSRDAGARAVYQLLDRDGLSFEALVGANDDTALGALKAFQERHIRVPDEVMVVGFDDIEESCFSAPPLTTVRQPLYEMGSKAVETLIGLIEGRSAPETIVVPATITIRQSCGCFRLEKTRDGLFQKSSGLSQEHKEQFFREVASVMERARMNAVEAIDDDVVREFSDSFIGEISREKPGGFLPVLSRVAWSLALAGGDTPGLLKAITVMRQLATAIFDGGIPWHVEEIFQKANLAIADSAARAQAHRRLDAERQSTLLRAAGQSIASAFDFSHLQEVIAAELSKLEIDNCWISLNTEPKFPLKKLRVFLSLGQEMPIEGPEFEAPDLVPAGMIGTGTRSLLVEPLFFREDQIGFAVFEVRKCRDGFTYEILRQHISSALKGAILMKKVQEQALALEIANQQLQKLREAEHAYLEAIKHELELGREIQGSFLPRALPEIDHWEIHPAFQPAREVSGDFYDVFKLPDGKIVLVISDVSGKDVGAALFMALINTLIRALTEQALSGATHPLDAVNLTNKYVINHHYGNNGRYMYATLFMGILDPERNVITYVNAGHNPPAVVSAQGGVRKWIETTGPAVGIVPDGQFSHNEIALEPGEMLFCYTDGVTEARGPEGAFFTKNKLNSILQVPIGSATEAIKNVEEAVKEHCAGQPPYDDITMLAVRRKI